MYNNVFPRYRLGKCEGYVVDGSFWEDSTFLNDILAIDSSSRNYEVSYRNVANVYVKKSIFSKYEYDGQRIDAMIYKDDGETASIFVSWSYSVLPDTIKRRFVNIEKCIVFGDNVISYELLYDKGLLMWIRVEASNGKVYEINITSSLDEPDLFMDKDQAIMDMLRYVFFSENCEISNALF